MCSESCTFIWHPRVLTRYVRAGAPAADVGASATVRTGGVVVVLIADKGTSAGRDPGPPRDGPGRARVVPPGRPRGHGAGARMTGTFPSCDLKELAPVTNAS
ncbi:hypothetical protein Cpa01nite_25860 [Cellulomonas pakistanensis]|uniref:Uncharacterized protein n=1 Tax=Cellulomonas pakistanensis TaxID=992287 RepID=A0A919PCT3_9CELL|nr:hypothetical protein Cpa01nite_25860 [Cellulomonas pakistanensis]